MAPRSAVAPSQESLAWFCLPCTCPAPTRRRASSRTQWNALDGTRPDHPRCIGSLLHPTFRVIFDHFAVDHLVVERVELVARSIKDREIGRASCREGVWV